MTQAAPTRPRLDLRFVFRFRVLIVTVVVVGLAASVFEAIGVSLFVPILQGMSETASPVPFPLSLVADQFRGLSGVGRVRVVAGLLVLVYGLKGLMIYLGGILSARLNAQGTVYQMTRCYGGVLGARLGYINAQQGSNLYSTLRQHVSRFGEMLRLIADTVPAALTVGVLLVVLVMVSWKMTLLAFAFGLLASIPTQWLQKGALHSGSDIAHANTRTDATVLDTIAGLKTIHLFGRAADMRRRFSAEMEAWSDSLIRLARVVSATAPLYEATNIAGVALLLVVGSFWFGPGQDSTVRLDILLTFLVVFYRMMPSLAALNRARVSVASLLPVCHHVQTFLDEIERQQVIAGARQWAGLTASVEFRDVSFGYDAARGRALERVSFQIARGSKVGIVGPSGAGKSTIAELLLQFYHPDGGTVLADGIDLREIDPVSWRRRIGVVTQDTFLFNDTIGANISFALPGASREIVERAAKRAHIHEFISQLPQGYDTVVGDRGVLLSGGQRQRLAIARAILADPEILVLDEATSALDSESEQAVQRALDEVSASRTVIAIAHRLSTVANSDVILVLDRGRVVEQGRHGTLLERQGGVYRRLAATQALIA